MRFRILAIMASTALVPTVALSQAPAQPPTPAQSGAQAQAPRAQTAPITAAEFVNNATNSSLFEIQSSQLAQQKSQNNRVREFAQKMVQDHTAAADRLKAAAQGQTVPTSLDPQHSTVLQQLQSVSGADFDRRYVQHQLTGHEEAVTLFDHFAQGWGSSAAEAVRPTDAPVLA